MSQPSTNEPVDGLRTPPGPQRWDWVGIVRQFLRNDSTDTLKRLKDDYGDIVNVYFDGDAYVLSSPAYIQHVLESNQGNYKKSDVYDEQLGVLFGTGLLTAEGELWRRQQALIRPMFRPTTLQMFVELIAEETNSMIDRWAKKDTPIDLLAETERITLLIIGRAMFSEEMEQHADDMRKALRIARGEFQRQTTAVDITVPRWIPTPHNRRLDWAHEYFDELVYGLIEKRRGSEDAHDDLLSMLMRARTENGERISDEQIRDEIITFLLAGHETTATALAWTWYLLAHHPERHRQLHERASAADWLDGTQNPMRSEESFVKQCVQEGMRIYPPVPVFSREVIETDQIGEYAVSAGSDVLLSQFLVHRDPSIWDDPLEYRPDRFANDGPDRPSYSYFPFGGGARMCIGRQFALLEAQIILGLTVQQHKLELEAPQYAHHNEIGRSSAVTMIPDEAITMRVEAWD